MHKTGFTPMILLRRPRVPDRLLRGLSVDVRRLFFRQFLGISLSHPYPRAPVQRANCLPPISQKRGWWDETDFHETRDTAFLLARLEELWRRVPRYKPLSVGVVLLDLVPAAHHQPDLFVADNDRRQKLSPLIDRINDRYGRCSIGFGLFPSDVRAFKGHAGERAFRICTDHEA
jgi:hypothetical protein